MKTKIDGEWWIEESLWATVLLLLLLWGLTGCATPTLTIMVEEDRATYQESGWQLFIGERAQVIKTAQATIMNSRAAVGMDTMLGMAIGAGVGIATQQPVLMTALGTIAGATSDALRKWQTDTITTSTLKGKF